MESLFLPRAQRALGRIRLPGSKWDSIMYQDKMIMIMDGVVLTVMAEEYHDPDLSLDQ